MKKMLKRSKDCISCTQQMTGIHSYEIRTECSECGGKALTMQDRENMRLKRTRAPARAA